jgi:LytS/YehU family sensor histidine kinase
LVDGLPIALDSSAIKLNANQKDIAISFISPYFSKPNKQYYRYRVNGGVWKSIDNSVCNLGNLEGGTSKIEIQNSLNKIKWANATTVIFEKEKALSNANILYIVIICVGLALIAFVSWIILKRIKVNALKRLQDEQQMNLLKHQAMNSLLSPHFIFNSLTSIQNYINTNNSLKASEYLAKFSRLIRMIIEKASQSEISLTDELTRLKYYLELEKERFKNKFDYHIEIDSNINQGDVKIPNMIIQPHVENCIIHGILPKMEHGNLFIRIKKIDAGLMQIQIEDDGIGLIKAKEHAKTGHKSLGTSTIKNILEINSKITGRKQEVTMIDKLTLNTNQTGTIITINLAL